MISTDVNMGFKNSQAGLSFSYLKPCVTIWFETIRADCHNITAEIGF